MISSRTVIRISILFFLLSISLAKKKNPEDIFDTVNCDVDIDLNFKLPEIVVKNLYVET